MLGFDNWFRSPPVVCELQEDPFPPTLRMSVYKDVIVFDQDNNFFSGKVITHLTLTEWCKVHSYKILFWGFVAGTPKRDGVTSLVPYNNRLAKRKGLWQAFTAIQRT